MKRRTLLYYMPFGSLALMEYAQAATKNIANSPLATTTANRPTVAAPYITASQMVQGLLEQHFLPSANAWQQSAQALARSLAQQGPLDAAAWVRQRPLWVQTMRDWEYLAAVAVGPLLERRSARAIDFWPTRPTQIRRLQQTGLGNITSVQQLDTLGAGARGLPALEWLLWKTDGSGHALPFAALLAQQIEQESTALVAGYQSLARTAREESDAWALYGEWFGQAVGGLNQLRIKKMVPDTRGKDSAPWVRGVSGQTAACWQAQAAGLQAFLTGSPATQAATHAATPGYPVAGSLDSLLLGRGHMAAHHALLKHTAAMLRTVQAARPAIAASVRAAMAALESLSDHVSDLAGGVLQISLGFTDADGD